MRSKSLLVIVAGGAGAPSSSSPPAPCPPLDTNIPVYAIGDPIFGGQFLVDKTAGQIPFSFIGINITDSK